MDVVESEGSEDSQKQVDTALFNYEEMQESLNLIDYDSVKSADANDQENELYMCLSSGISKPKVLLRCSCMKDLSGSGTCSKCVLASKCFKF